jgi:hypothetical protein
MLKGSNSDRKPSYLYHISYVATLESGLTFGDVTVSRHAPLKTHEDIEDTRQLIRESLGVPGNTGLSMQQIFLLDEDSGFLN